MSDIDTGLNVWQMQSNHNRMIEIQNEQIVGRDGPVEIRVLRQLGVQDHFTRRRECDDRSVA